MTVETTQNKMPPLQMGTATEYPFTFAVLLQDPTEEEALKAIKANVLQADGTEIELEYGVDYTVNLNTDRIGGTLFIKDVRTSSDYLTIYREYTHTQEADYQDLNAAPAETFEQCFDKLTMLSQQQQEAIDRSLKLNISSTTVSPTLPDPIANNTLIWDSKGASLKNYDVIGENKAFQENFVNKANADFENFKSETNNAIKTFEDGIDAKIESVAEASGKIAEFEESISIAVDASNIAIQKASEATNSANEANSALLDIENKIVANDVKMANSVAKAEKASADAIDVFDNALTKSQITNCILEVPQKINLTLSGGTLTLKAGSKVIVPNGTGVFNEITITSDKVFNNTALGNREAYIIVRTNSLDIQIPPIASCSSGTSTPSSGWYYNTSENKIYRDGNFESACLPIAKVTYANGVGVTSIDQVFNGMGYIGSTNWIDKGVKYLAPNGRNADGTLKNLECEVPKLTLRTRTDTWSGDALMAYYFDGNSVDWTYNYYTESETKPTPTFSTWRWFNTKENKIYYTSDTGATWKVHSSPIAILGSKSLVSGKISSLIPKNTFKAVDYNDFVNTPRVVETYKNSTSWYRVYSDGWIEQGGKSATPTTITLLKPYSDANYTVQITATEPHNGANYQNISASGLTTTQFMATLSGNNQYVAGIYWSTCGY